MEYRPLSMRIVQTIAYTKYTKTLFKKVDREFRKEKVRAALRHVAKRKKVDSYECLVDFLYAELFMDQAACHAYYSGASDTKLRDKLSKQLIKEREAFMLDCLELATVLHERDLANDWNEKTDLHIWNMWHHNNRLNSRGSSRTWTAFRTMALHLQNELTKGKRSDQDETN